MKIGVLGAGAIANKVISAVVQLDKIQCWAVASRDLEKAQAFAEKYGFPKAYGSYEELVSDPEVELVYVATPHSHHFDHIMLCLTHGKAVLCEKAFTLNAEQAKKIKEYAQERQLYTAEAIWTRYMPSRAIIQETIHSGIIGTPNTLTANLSYPITHKQRVMDPALGGGALLDIGVYGLNFALMHFGADIQRIESLVRLTDTGVDGMETITLFYRDGRMAVLTHSIYCRSDRKGIIHGDKGYIVVENINDPQSIAVYDANDNLLSFREMPPQINGYEYEFLEAEAALRTGRTESDSMPLAETVRVMELMDSLRKQWGVVFPQEK